MLPFSTISIGGKIKYVIFFQLFSFLAMSLGTDLDVNTD